MLTWTLFLVVALIAAAFGFGGIAAGAAGFARVRFFIFLVLFVVSLISNAVAAAAPPPEALAGSVGSLSLQP